MSLRRVAIASTGKYLPAASVTSKATALRYGRDSDWIERHSGIQIRHRVVNETASFMGAEAARMALQRAELCISDIDCIVCTSGCPEQSFPCTAALVQRELGGRRMPAFDINSSCLSFVTGLDTISYLIDAGKFRRVLLVASEVCAGVDWDDPESGMLFGDGAAAAVVEMADSDSRSGILGSAMETYGEAAHLSQCIAGGNRYRPEEYQAMLPSILFQMDGRALYKLAAQHIPPIVDGLLDSCAITLADVDVVIPHQASASAMHLIRRNLGVEPERWIDILATHGNTIAASIPLALHEAVTTGRLRRGGIGMMLGTAAGFSVGALIFRY